VRGAVGLHGAEGVTARNREIIRKLGTKNNEEKNSKERTIRGGLKCVIRKHRREDPVENNSPFHQKSQRIEEEHPVKGTEKTKMGRGDDTMKRNK
jgi:hypothetical protein